MKQESLFSNQDPRGMYLLGLGNAINSLVQKETETSWFNSTYKSEGKEYYTFTKRKEWIDDLHKKAMEVINTMNEKV